MESSENWMEDLMSLPPRPDRDTLGSNEQDFCINESDAARYRQELRHIYSVTDKVTEFLINRESRSRMGNDKFTIVDVRLEPTCKWMMIYYTLVQYGRNYREQYPMLWSTFYDLTKQDDSIKSKNPWTMETTVFQRNPDPKSPPTRYKLRPFCRTVTVDEAIKILQEQA